ncbi:hypothetical protein BJ741DRAFT_647712 [Chytriomyces cf. hyalinus JEL632]|nr:hypothetical protein BJ741DRAFT_647712 [Chytriomyces cf. hyalinus JEL632]
METAPARVSSLPWSFGPSKQSKTEQKFNVKRVPETQKTNKAANTHPHSLQAIYTQAPQPSQTLMSIRFRGAEPISSVFPTSSSATSSNETAYPQINMSDSLTTLEDYDRFTNPHFPPDSENAAEAVPLSLTDVLPYEVLSRIFWFLDTAETISNASMGQLTSIVTTSTQLFEATSKMLNRVSNDPHARCHWLITRYGTRLALFYAFKFHRTILTPEVGQLMLASGSLLPRFLVQLVDKEYHQRVDRVRKQIPIPTLMFFLQAGYHAYGKDVDFREDDVARFERSLYGVTNTAQESMDIVKSLITDFRFVPMRGLGSPVDETVYLVSKLDINFIPLLVRNGLDILFVNDLIMERLLWRTDVTDSLVSSYLRVGFQLSAPAVKKGLQMGRPPTLDILKKYISMPMLETYAEDTVYDMFGPSIRGWNFTSEAIDFLRSQFTISDDTMERAILRFPNGIDPNSTDAFPATRSYMKANPCPVWRWILRMYGPSHRLTMACFDDAISRAAAERELHALHDVFLESGVRFRPRHVKILACRVLHRDMTSNALHLLKIMRQQILAASREYLKQQQGIESENVVGGGSSTIGLKTKESFASSSSFNFIFGSGITSGLSIWGGSTQPIATLEPSISALSTMLTAGAASFEPLVASPASLERNEPRTVLENMIPTLTPDQRLLWLAAFTEEVTANEEWETRMRTTQLEGGPRGGAYRIAKAPEDAVRFLEEAKQIVSELTALEKLYNNSHRSSATNAAATVVKTMSNAPAVPVKADSMLLGGRKGKIVTRSLSSSAATFRRGAGASSRPLGRNLSLSDATSGRSEVTNPVASLASLEESERPPSAAIESAPAAMEPHHGFLMSALNRVSNGNVQGNEDSDLDVENAGDENARQGARPLPILGNIQYNEPPEAEYQEEEEDEEEVVEDFDGDDDEGVFDLEPNLESEGDNDEDDTATITAVRTQDAGLRADVALHPPSEQVSGDRHSAVSSLPSASTNIRHHASTSQAESSSSSRNIQQPNSQRRKMSEVFITRRMASFWKSTRK